MKRIVLTRTEQNDSYTKGVLEVEGQPPFMTLEPPWRNNEQKISCIPPGDYVCEQVISPRFGVTWEVTEVPDRSLIRFHQLNWVEETEGCVGVGGLFKSAPVPHLENSQVAFNRFRNALKDEKKILLSIQQPEVRCELIRKNSLCLA
jgi:hypothetical protein